MTVSDNGATEAIYQRIGGPVAANACLKARGHGDINMTDGLTLSGAAIIVAYAIVMLGVCLLACVVPTRRALGVEPTVALRMD